jgi:hypothetical protein
LDIVESSLFRVCADRIADEAGHAAVALRSSPDRLLRARDTRTIRHRVQCDQRRRLIVLCYVSFGLWGGLGERDVIEVDGLLAGAAAAGPALEERLHEQHGLRECQAGRG